MILGTNRIDLLKSLNIKDIMWNSFRNKGV